MADGRTELIITSLELIDRLAHLVTPPRIHKHRYCGVLAPDVRLRRAVTASAGPQPELDFASVDSQAGQTAWPENGRPASGPKRGIRTPAQPTPTATTWRAARSESRQ